MNKELIIKALEKASGLMDVALEFTENEQFGDYSSNIALSSCSQSTDYGSPRKFADEIVSKLSVDSSLLAVVSKIEVAGPGFINFWLKTDVLVSNLIQIEEEKEKYGESDFYKGKRLVFEYAHPNTHKAFHIGHLRNITTGEALARLHEAVGARVVRANYQGDVGLHIAKAIWGIRNLGLKDPGNITARAEYLGKAYSNGATKYEEDEKIKKEIHSINEKIYNKSDLETNKLYKETRQWSLDYFEIIYKRVYTKFDRYYFESEVADEGKKIALEALKDGILKKSEGAVIFEGSKYGLHDRVFITGKGVPTYEGKDLGLAKLQFSEYDPDLLIHTVGPEQTEYFKVVFKALEFIQPETKGREVHIPYGWVKLKEGKMSSRSGNVILGESILDEAKEKIIKVYKTKPEVAEQIAVGAVKYSFLKTGLAQDIAFDLKESISLEGNSGPYLQYTIARTNSVLLKALGIRHKAIEKLVPSAYSLMPEEYAVLRLLSRFGEIISIASKNYSPNILCNYLYELASKFNTLYNKHRILVDSGSRLTAHSSPTSEFRLLLTSATGQVLKNGLRLLGIDAPEKM